MKQLSIDVNGIQLAGIGDGAGGSPILLVHGFTGCKEDFVDELAPLAALGYHAVAPELRGHGASDAPTDEAEYSFEIFATDVFGFADSLGWDTFDLLGHSMGGMIAQVMALRHPERISRLILMDTHHGIVDDIDHDLVALGIEVARTQGLKVIQEVLQMAAKPEDNVAYERICAERPGYREFAENKMLASSPAMYAAMLRELSSTPDRLDLLEKILMPTLVQVGGLDAAFVPASGRMAARIPGATFDTMPDAGHCPQFESTNEWRQSLHRFLDRTTVLENL